MDPFVSVEKYRGKAVIRVRIGEKFRRYPLTKAGCLEAGRDIFKSGAESWMNSSSVDFPQEVKPGFRWDVRELMDVGFRECLEKAEAPRKSMVKKMLAWCSGSFQQTLTPEEQAAFEAICERVAGE